MSLPWHSPLRARPDRLRRRDHGKKVGIVIDTGTAASMILHSSADRLDPPRHEFRGSGVMLGLGERRVETAVVDEFKPGDATTTSITFYDPLVSAHRTLVSHSQHRMYFTCIGGPVFAPYPLQSDK